MAANATRWQILRSRGTEQLHRLLNRLGVPGVIRPMRYHDAVTGQQIEVKTGVFFTVVSIDCRDYYFDRVTGRFDGTGTGCL